MTTLRRLAPLAVLPLVLLAAGCGGGTTTPSTSSSQCTYTKDGTSAKKVTLPPGTPPTDEPTQLTISTDRGDIKVSLDADKAPCTVNSFVSLAKQGFFDNTHCHRLTVQGLYVLQCGSPTATGQSGNTAGANDGPGYRFADELIDNDPRLQPCLGQTDPSSGQEICTYTAGTLAMANSGPDTNGSQFFLVYKNSPLGAAYTDFGQMSASGVKVVQDVAKQGTAPDGVAPKEPVTITSVR